MLTNTTPKDEAQPQNNKSMTNLTVQNSINPPINPMDREKRNIYIKGKRTTISVESYVWVELDQLTRDENISIDELCTVIDQNRDKRFSLSAVIRYLSLKVHTIKNQPDRNLSNFEGEFAEMPVTFPSPFYQALESIRDISQEQNS